MICNCSFATNPFVFAAWGLPLTGPAHPHCVGMGVGFLFSRQRNVFGWVIGKPGQAPILQTVEVVADQQKGAAYECASSKTASPAIGIHARAVSTEKIVSIKARPCKDPFAFCSCMKRPLHHTVITAPGSLLNSCKVKLPEFSFALKIKT